MPIIVLTAFWSMYSRCSLGDGRRARDEEVLVRASPHFSTCRSVGGSGPTVTEMLQPFYIDHPYEQRGIPHEYVVA